MGVGVVSAVFLSLQLGESNYKPSRIGLHGGHSSALIRFETESNRSERQDLRAFSQRTELSKSNQNPNHNFRTEPLDPNIKLQNSQNRASETPPMGTRKSAPIQAEITRQQRSKPNPITKNLAS